MEADKRRVGAALCLDAGWRFVPVCVETTGAWGSDAQRLVRGLVRRQGMRCGTPVATAAASVWKRLVTAVAKGTAQMLVRAYPGVFGRAGAEGARWGAPMSLSALPLEQSAVGEAPMEVEP